MTREEQVEAAWQQRYPEPRPVVLRRLRRRISAEQNHRCCYCGLVTTDDTGQQTSGTLEHVLPRSWGGGDGYDNLVLACHGCNVRRGKRMDTLPILIFCAMRLAAPGEWPGLGTKEPMTCEPS